MCMTVPLGDEPAVVLGCRHVFHVNCVVRKIKAGWFNASSHHIHFNFMNCPICAKEIKVPQDCYAVKGEMAGIRELKKKVTNMALKKAQEEQLD